MYPGYLCASATKHHTNVQHRKSIEQPSRIRKSPTSRKVRRSRLGVVSCISCVSMQPFPTCVRLVHWHMRYCHRLASLQLFPCSSSLKLPRSAHSGESATYLQIRCTAENDWTLCREHDKDTTLSYRFQQWIRRKVPYESSQSFEPTDY